MYNLFASKNKSGKNIRHIFCHVYYHSNEGGQTAFLSGEGTYIYENLISQFAKEYSLPSR